MTWRRPSRCALLLLFACALAAKTLAAQAPGPEQSFLPPAAPADRGSKEKEKEAVLEPVPIVDRKESLVHQIASDFVSDQKDLWTAPAHLRFSDTTWLVPLSGITAGLLVTDASYSRSLSRSASTISRNNTMSNVGVAGLLGGASALWLFGTASHNEHWRETGFLASQAALNSFVVIEATKYSFGRERPNQGNGDGNFFSGGTSFPSEHAAAAWAVAGVIAHEYPGPLTKILAYSAASAVTYGRVHSLNHFRSDVLVGAVIGNLAAAQVYQKRHNPELGGESWLTASDLAREASFSSDTSNFGSPYVPLDSWVYPVLDRLVAFGYIHTAMLGARPWTRLECVRLLNEADEAASRAARSNAQVESMLESLTREFAADRELGATYRNESMRLDSVYSQATGISGDPLTDGYFFGQTIDNNFGRPYQSGFNSVTGVTGWATQGPLVAYTQMEYQFAPSAPALPLSARQYMATAVNFPGVPPATPTATTSQVQFLDTYVGYAFRNWQMTFGKQSLWWGPTEGGPLMFSDNAVPVNLFRVSRTSPFTLPYVFNFLGPMTLEFFLGQLSGQEFVYRTDTGIQGAFGSGIDRQPFLQGEKFSFKPTENFEFSVSLSVMFSGGPTPLTPHYYFHSFSLNGGASNQQGSTTDPGDRRSGVDFNYRLPGLRWITFYGDAMTEDEYSPLGYPRKSAVQGGLYFSRIPGLPKLDLRLEGGTTVPADFPGCTYGCFYTNNRYPNGFTNSGNLMGSTLGRGSQAERAWTTWWFTPRSKLQLYYAHQKLESDMIPGGGTINHGGARLDFQFRPNLALTGSLQYEKWNIPVLQPLPQSDWTTSLGVTYWPRHLSFYSKN